jgi:hypothetical protein
MTEPGTSQQQKAPRLNHAQATKLREYCDKGYELKNKKDLQDVVSEVGCTEHQAKSAWGRLRRAANQNKSQSAVEAGAPTGGVCEPQQADTATPREADAGPTGDMAAPAPAPAPAPVFSIDAAQLRAPGAAYIGELVYQYRLG